jgi:hypothetical protein
MLTKTRRGLGLPALLAIGLLYVLPSMAEAQLFPNRTIRRQREACAAEPPFNNHVRRDYFGYYPTCWSKFPDGWACPCPNPELPDPAKSFRDIPLSIPPNPADAESGLGTDRDDRAMPGEPPTTDPNLPPVPDRNRSPFDLDTKPDAPAPPGNANPPAGPGGNPATSSAGRISAPTALREMPRLPAVAPTSTTEESNLVPGSIAMVPDATLASNGSSSRPDLGPLPAADSGPMVDPEPPVVGAPPSAPAQAPQRKSLLGGLFNRRKR